MNWETNFAIYLKLRSLNCITNKGGHFDFHMYPASPAWFRTQARKRDLCIEVSPTPTHLSSFHFLRFSSSWFFIHMEDDCICTHQFLRPLAATDRWPFNLNSRFIRWVSGWLNFGRMSIFGWKNWAQRGEDKFTYYRNDFSGWRSSWQKVRYLWLPKAVFYTTMARVRYFGPIKRFH